MRSNHLQIYGNCKIPPTRTTHRCHETNRDAVYLDDLSWDIGSAEQEAGLPSTLLIASSVQAACNNRAVQYNVHLVVGIPKSVQQSERVKQLIMSAGLPQTRSDQTFDVPSADLV